METNACKQNYPDLYKTLNGKLRDLKKQGKTVVVITHDDQYFGIADRCIKLADGQLADHVRDVSTIGLATPWPPAAKTMPSPPPGVAVKTLR